MAPAPPGFYSHQKQQITQHKPFLILHFLVVLHLVFAPHFMLKTMTQLFHTLRNSVFALFLSLSMNSFAQVYLSEKFNGNAIPSTWTVQNQGTGACQWMVHAPHSIFGTPVTMLGSNYLFVNSDSAGSNTVANETVTSPTISIPVSSIAFVQFDHYIRCSGAFRKDTGIVEVFNGTNWISIKKYSQTVGAGDAPVQAKLDISSYINPDFKIRFRYVGDFAYYWAVDNLVVFTPSPNDVGIRSIAKPSTTCGLPASFIIKSTLFNFGSVAQTSIPLSYTVGNQAPVSETFTGNLLPGDSVVYTFAVPFFPSNQGTYSFSSWTQLATDLLPNNDSTLKVNMVRNASGMLPVSFTNFTGSNLTTALPGWSEANGLNPSGTTSNWNSPAAVQSSLGGNPARINLFGNTRKEWIISPAFNPANGAVIRFKLALTNHNLVSKDSMGSDDSLIVKVSTNCGLTWNRVKWFTKTDIIANQLTTQIVPFSGFAGQTIRFAFYATDGSVNDANDFDLLIDQMEILVPSPTDLSLSGMPLPSASCGVGNSLLLKVRVFNNGTEAQTSIPVSYSVNGQIPFSETFTGNLAPGAEATFTFTTPILFPNAGNYLISAWTKLPGDVNTINDSIRNKQVTRSPFGFATQTFTGFTGSNLSTISPGWNEATGLSAQTTGSSGWTINGTTQITSLGSQTAKINLFSNNKKDWILSPKILVTSGYVLRFKSALTNFSNPQIDSMGSDDSLIVKISTDCGLTWSNLKIIIRDNQPGNQLETYIVPLTAFVGENIQIGFYATEGNVNDPNDYDFHIDNIEILIPSPSDLGVSQIILPSGECGASSSLNVKVQVFNNGSQTQSSIPVFYSVNGQSPVSETFTSTLAPGENGILTFTNPTLLPSAGTYTFSAWTSLTGDLNMINDTVRNVSIKREPASFPLTTFTGFTGGNLGTVFPGWKEQTGMNPIGTTSAWVNSSTNQTTSLGSLTAKINLLGNTKQDWLVSPPFNPESGMVLKFKVAVTNTGTAAIDSMGSDDSVHVKMTVNCGQKWTKLKSFARSSALGNSLSAHSVSLPFISGQTLRIAFHASEGSINNANDYDFHVDNVQVVIPQNKDVGVSDIVFPNADCSAPPTLAIKVRLSNFGAEAQTGIPVSYKVNSNAIVTETFTGNLLAGQSAVYTFASQADLSAGGTFLFSAWTSLTGDAEATNDSIRNRSLTTPSTSLSAVSFTGFDGLNLTDLFPGWVEQSGQQPTGSTSSWFNNTASQATALGSAAARIGMAGNTKRDWMVSPVFICGPNTSLSFRLAITERNFSIPDAMGSDDSLNIMVSTDCGSSWTRVRSFTPTSALTNVLTAFTVDLTAFSGQSCRVGFFATEGNVDNINDYDLHLDDVEVKVISGLNYEISHRFTVYPNPSKDAVWIESSAGFSNLKISLLSSDGKQHDFTLYQKGVDRIQLDIHTLPAGLYILKMADHQSVITKTLVVIR